MNRSLLRTFLVIAGGFVVLFVALAYWQVIDANAIDMRPGNPQTLQRNLMVRRGAILAADGTPLAESSPVRQLGPPIFRSIYPDGTLAPQTVGYSDPQRGLAGLELSQNRFLSGDFGAESLLEHLGLRPRSGATVRTTLIPSAERVADAMLAGKRGAVVALDPQTGAIEVMASAPGFDLNDIATRFRSIRAASGAPLLNRAVQAGYPPGSTFKVVTTVAALESGLFTPQSHFIDTGSVVASGTPLHNFAHEVFGANTLTQALTYSIDTTYAKVGMAVGSSRLGATMNAFGFGRAPSSDLPPGMVLPSGRSAGPGLAGSHLLPDDQPGEDVARLAIGQERLLVTPLQMAMVAAGIADGGEIMTPYLVQQVTGRDGAPVLIHHRTLFSTAATPEVASQVSVMMRDVVNEGTGTAAALAGLAVAGKTGTAETGVPGLNDASFIGFAPAPDPRVAVAVFVEDTPEVGGTAAAPIARAVMQAVLAFDSGSRG